jgi:hypothetical protein
MRFEKPSSPCTCKIIDFIVLLPFETIGMKLTKANDRALMEIKSRAWLRLSYDRGNGPPAGRFPLPGKSRLLPDRICVMSDRE